MNERRLASPEEGRKLILTDVSKQIRSGKLYPLLSICTKEDLDPLVEIILSRPLNFLNVDVAYKVHKPDHTRYHSVIGNEIRLFGGNSIGNLFRGGEGPSYSEIVVDVCKKLGVPYNKNDTVGNEANLLDIFVQERWQSLDSGERRRLIEVARKAASGKLSYAANPKKAAAMFLMRGVATLPAAWVAPAFILLDANFKVTVPCVLHIAYLRRRHTEQWQEENQSFGPGPTASAPAARSSALVIVAEDGEPVLSLARIPEPSVQAGWHRIGASDDGISRLNPLLAAVPSLAVAGEVASTSYMEVLFNGTLAAAKGEGGGFRGFSIGNGGITGHARLFEANQLAAMVNVSALMNVASIALAQKHLADISRKLGEIKEAIDGIRKFQGDERRSKLTGSIRYFEQVAPGVLEGKRPARVLNQIENHEAELLQVQEHIKADFHTELKRLRDLKDDEWFGSAETKAALEEHQLRVVELYRELVLCLRARSCGWQLLCLFPGEEIGKAHRRQTIQNSLDELATDREMMTETDALLRKKIYELSSSWNTETTINERKLALLKANEILLSDMATCRAEVERDLQAADEMLGTQREAVPMIARIEDGRITAIRAL